MDILGGPLLSQSQELRRMNQVGRAGVTGPGKSREPQEGAVNREKGYIKDKTSAER